ncbi:MAG: OmpA family protein [Polyangiaceae bacterium]|nr:OmpA family protein [Polyangiaceae bacterium]
MRRSVLVLVLGAVVSSGTALAQGEPAAPRVGDAGETAATAEPPAAGSDDAASTAAPAPPTEGAADTTAVSSEPLAATAAGGSTKPAGRTVEPTPGAPSFFRPMQFETGAFIGLLFISPDHNFHEESQEHQKLATAFTLGKREGFMFLPYAGVEVEGMLGISRTEDDQSAKAAALRMHAVGQIPLGRVAPFVVVGGGGMGGLSDRMGNDLDPTFHFGAGAKIGLGEHGIIRVDLRDNVSQKNDADLGAGTHHFELAVGLSLPVRFKKAPLPEPVPLPDADGDGVPDTCDHCPDEGGIPPTGCMPTDTDGDDIIDEVDRCPNQPGVAPDGCPVDPDPDEDGFEGEADQCPKEAGVAPDGCPARDTDQDGIFDPDDRCPKEPETLNGIDDKDGCPDEVPREVQEFTGVLQGIEFDLGKATIRPRSHPILDKAVRVLTDYPTLRIRILGHTDNLGTREKNLALSADRAESVKAYFVEKGVDSNRVETAGRGPDQPLVSNDNEQGRQKNRRIEIELLR